MGFSCTFSKLDRRDKRLRTSLAKTHGIFLLICVCVCVIIPTKLIVDITCASV